MKTITAQELNQALVSDDGILVDVRTPAEFETVHAQSAINVPLDELSKNTIHALRRDSGATIYLICQSGSRTKTACKRLADASNIVAVEGGTQAWIDCGLPVIEGKKSISLERQVRIAAGSLVVLGTLLGALVSSWLLIITGFVGAGLVFAGVTDTCGMAMILGKCPWNRQSPTTLRKEVHS